MNTSLFFSCLSLLTWAQALQTLQHMNVNCVKTQGIPPGWLYEPAASPSVMKTLRVSVAENGDDDISHSGLRLNISWAVNIDKSIEYLTATYIDVNQRVFKCLYEPPFRNVTITLHEEVWFHFTEFPAEPETTYFVTGCNLPVPMAGGDSYLKNEMFKTDDCNTGQLKYHDSCIKKGSLWKPSIMSAFLNGQVEINFTASRYSETYDIELWRNSINQLVATAVCNTKGESKCSKVLSFAGPCEPLEIRIRPHFPGCADTCDERTTEVDCRKTGSVWNDLTMAYQSFTCVFDMDRSMGVVQKVALVPHSSSENPSKKTDYTMVLWIVLWCVLGAVALVLFSVSAGREAKRACLRFVKVTENPAPISVLIVYPALSSTFQKAVVTLAEFINSQCNCMVTIDVWQRGRVAEMGLMHWLTEQMEVAEKVIFVTGGAKGFRPILGPTEYVVPASVEDMFSLALNIMASGVRDPLVLRKHVTVYLGRNLSDGNLPVALTPCRSFCLMRDLDRLCSHLHENQPSRSFLDFTSTRSMTSAPPQKDRATTKLRNAIQDLQMWEEALIED